LYYFLYIEVWYILWYLRYTKNYQLELLLIE